MRTFQTTSTMRLNYDALPLRMYRKAKKLGIWDPEEINFERDREDWLSLDEKEQEKVVRILSQFQAGEEAVTIDLLPLIDAIAKQGKLEEELFLTTFLFEEAKHTEFFRRFLDEVVQSDVDLTMYHTPAYRTIFYDMLPNAMNRLRYDTSIEAIAEASFTYNMMVEGVIAETGYFLFFEGLKKRGLFPGLLEGITYVKTDESRHVGYGTYLIQRLICEDEDTTWNVVSKKLNECIPILVKYVQENFSPENLLAGLDYSHFLNYSSNLLLSRVNILQRARGKTVDELFQIRDMSVDIF